MRASLGEFHYRLREPISGSRPGSHPGSALGSGQDFAAHARLFDNPDPRRIDMHASLRNVRRDWLVKLYLQRSAIPVYAVVDVSESMCFGAPQSKRDIAADFVESLGYSTFRAGDPVALLAFDVEDREDLYVPARHSRGVGTLMADYLRGCTPTRAQPARPDGGRALSNTVLRLTGKTALVFLVSDFHWSLEALPGALDVLNEASVIPVVLWDPAEVDPPRGTGYLKVQDVESGARRSLWVGETLRERWRSAVAARRAALEAVFAARGIRPFYLQGEFDPEDLSRYFYEEYV
jgi:uncharacterized protein (DUF58 family)